jgi:hypothetical protein
MLNTYGVYFSKNNIDSNLEQKQSLRVFKYYRIKIFANGESHIGEVPIPHHVIENNAHANPGFIINERLYESYEIYDEENDISCFEPLLYLTNGA